MFSKIERSHGKSQGFSLHGSLHGSLLNQFKSLNSYLFFLSLLLLSYIAHPFPIPSTPTSQSLPPIVHTHESSICVSLLAPLPSFPHYLPPLFPLVTVCSLFPSLWFYFAHLFVFLIRLDLQVRSNGTCSIHLLLSSPSEMKAKLECLHLLGPSLQLPSIHYLGQIMFATCSYLYSCFITFTK